MRRLISLAMIVMLGIGLFGTAQPASAGNGSVNPIPAECAATATAPRADVRFATAGVPLNGGTGAQVIIGSPGDDIIDGGSGNDIICGGGGNDRITGGSGNDRIFGNDGNDTLLGESGGDLLDGGGGADACDGGTGSNTLVSCNDAPPVGPSVTITQAPFDPEIGVCLLTSTVVNGSADETIVLDVLLDSGERFNLLLVGLDPAQDGSIFSNQQIVEITAFVNGTNEPVTVTSFPTERCVSTS